MYSMVPIKRILDRVLKKFFPDYFTSLTRSIILRNLNSCFHLTTCKNRWLFKTLSPWSMKTTEWVFKGFMDDNYCFSEWNSFFVSFVNKEAARTCKFWAVRNVSIRSCKCFLFKYVKSWLLTSFNNPHSITILRLNWNFTPQKMHALF